MIVLPSLCAACPIVAPLLPATAVLPCLHRGELLRHEPCKRGCPSEREAVPIHACGVHGECSLRTFARDQATACCLTCPELSIAPDPDDETA